MEKSDSISLALATVSILGQAPRALIFFCLFTLGGCQTVTVNCPVQTINLHEADSANFELLDQAPRGDQKRASTALSLWQEHCPQIEETKIPRTRLRNYSCVIPGQDARRILIGAHYDKARLGYGVADNWSGILITSNLLRYFAEAPGKYTLEFVAFGEEENEMRGAQAFLQRRDIGSIVAMINVDTIGLRSLLIDERSSVGLKCLAENAATALGVEFGTSGFTNITGDWAPFKARGIPVLNLHSVDRSTIKRIHSRKDRPGNVKVLYLQEAYELILNVITNFDRIKN